MTLDFTTEHGQMALNQLENDVVIWFTTVTPNGMPQPNPVWFIWDGEAVIIWVQPASARLKNFETNRQVSLHFAGDPLATHMTVLTGEAEIDESIGALNENPIHVAKYEARWKQLGMTPAEAAKEYSVPIRVRPTRLRGF